MVLSGKPFFIVMLSSIVEFFQACLIAESFIESRYIVIIEMECQVVGLFTYVHTDLELAYNINTMYISCSDKGCQY